MKRNKALGSNAVSPGMMIRCVLDRLDQLQVHHRF